ncbi:DUF4166 domain-containing protein [Ovoidimarina sediminis]|uniref:DUF4166 domain-containing protein n=1 Tax=Ovoidimarina sediminis TaxID=3079856 RepID=UPI002930640A|nr:DUF4166 domain-containing protein [Rhodophyticola sp. MJ-SS7]
MMQAIQKADTGSYQSDNRFRALLGDSAWAGLPEAVQARFGKRLRAGMSVTYQGEVTAMRFSIMGWILAQILRPVGAPLPYDVSSVGQAAVVVVTEDGSTGGQFWIRQYSRAAGFPQVVHSSKRFRGVTGLEEYIGYGIGMALRIRAAPSSLIFESDHYFFEALGLRLRLPRWLTPGALEIGHHDEGTGCFRFSLRLTHSLFGEVLSQDAVFRDAGPHHA